MSLRRRLSASIEIPARTIIGSSELADLVPRGTRVYIPDVSNDSEATRAAAAKRLHDLGYIAVPHLAARRLTSRLALENTVKTFTQQAGVSDMLLIAGDAAPHGEFTSSLDVLETGILDRYGIAQIGIAGHPEGNPNVPEAVVLQALKLKADFQARSDAKLRIVTQFGFDADAIIRWTASLQQEGIILPVHLGVSGPTKIATLIKYAALCGVGNSLNFLKKRAGSLGALMSGFSPEDIVTPIENHALSSVDFPIKQLHLFAFGGIRATSTWLEERGSWSARVVNADGIQKMWR